jgi:predicted patatin/cPLA2 family phospholipase
MPAGLAAVLSGGGSKGAFQVGVLDELISAKKVKLRSLHRRLHRVDPGAGRRDE